MYKDYARSHKVGWISALSIIWIIQVATNIYSIKGVEDLAEQGSRNKTYPIVVRNISERIAEEARGKRTSILMGIPFFGLYVRDKLSQRLEEADNLRELDPLRKAGYPK